MAGTELGVGYVSLTASGRGFGRSIIREARAAGSTAGDSASSSFGSRFVSGMGRIGRRAGIALAAGVTAAGFFGIRLAADFEQTRIAFEGILGDVDKANKLIGELRDFAAKTPFEFTNLTKSAQQLLAVGVAAEDIIPTMAILGDTAATLGVGTVEIEGVVRALGQMKGKGKVSAEELRQISEQLPGFSAINAIAEDLGVTVAEAFALVESGAVSADEGIEAILTGMQNFPGAAGAMERQSKTLNGVLSTFKDTLAIMAIDFITPYLPALSAGVTTLSGWLQNTLVPGLETFAGWIGTLVDYWGPGLAEMFNEHLIPTVKGLAEDGLQAISDWWDRNGEALTEFFTNFASTAVDVFEGIGDVIWETVLPALKDIGGWLVSDGPGAELAITALAAAFALWAFNAALAAAATIATFWPLGLFIVVVGGATWATQALIDKFKLMPKASQAIQWVVDHVLEPMLSLLNKIKAAIERIIELLPSVKMPGGGGGWLDMLKGSVPIIGPVLKRFDDGGVMPGRRGVHYPAMVAGGETILPTHKAELPDLLGQSNGSGFRDLTIVGNLGEDPVERAFHEARKAALV